MLYVNSGVLSRLTLVIASLFLCGCLGSFDFKSGSSSTSSTYSEIFSNKLVENGMDSADAEYIQESIEASSSAVSQSASSEEIALAEQIFQSALLAVASDEHFPAATDKQYALLVIFKSHVQVAVSQFSYDDMKTAMDSSLMFVGDAVEDLGLSGADLEEGLYQMGRGLIEGVEQAGYNSSQYQSLAETFANSLMNSVYEGGIADPLALSVAFAEGSLQALSDSSEFDSSLKNQLLGSFLNGCDLVDSGDDDLLGEVDSAAQDLMDEVYTAKTCSAQTLSYSFDGDQGFGLETYTCSGPMPTTMAGTQGVWGISSGGEQNVTIDLGGGVQMTGFSTGPSCNVASAGVHYHTVTSSAFGTCEHYCTVIADCNANGEWENITYTW